MVLINTINSQYSNILMIVFQLESEFGIIGSNLYDQYILFNIMSSELQPQILLGWWKCVVLNGLKQKDITWSLGTSQGCVSKVLEQNKIYGNPRQKHRSGRP